MTTNKAKANKSIAKANENALKGFPKAKLTQAMDLIAETATAIEGTQESKATAALTICNLAHGYRDKNAEATAETVAKGWNDEWRALALQLAIAGNKFAELKKGKDDKPDSARMTGYGRNVTSIAKGVIEFQLDPANLTTIDDEGNEVAIEKASYRDVRKIVEAKRAEARRISDPDTAALNDAVAELEEHWDALKTLVLDQKDTGLIGDLGDMLDGIAQDVQAQLDEQARIQEEVEAAKAEVDPDHKIVDDMVADAESA